MRADPAYVGQIRKGQQRRRELSPRRLTPDIEVTAACVPCLLHQLQLQLPPRGLYLPPAACSCDTRREGDPAFSTRQSTTL